jgi:hypothetical protein
MMAKLNAADDANGWVLAVNAGDLTLERVVPFCKDTFHYYPSYQQCAFSKHLSKAPGDFANARLLPIRRHPVVKRSTRIAVRLLSHIPTSRRGEVLLNMRMGIEPPAAPISPAPKSLREAILTVNLTSSQIDALDGYFPAAIHWTDGTLLSDIGLDSHGATS